MDIIPSTDSRFWQELPKLRDKFTFLMSKKTSGGGFVYSTNPDFMPEDDGQPLETLMPGKQTLIVAKSSKGRGGKIATLVTGFQGREEDLENLCRKLKNKCGVGGAAKDGEIIIQGEVREKVAEILRADGYKVKISGL